MKIKYVILFYFIVIYIKSAKFVLLKNSDRIVDLISSTDSQMPLAMMSNRDFKSLSTGQDLSPLPPLNVNSEWMKPQRGASLNMNRIDANDPSQAQTLHRLDELNKQLDEELSKLKPINNGFSPISNTNLSYNNFSAKFLQVDSSSFPTTKINGFDSKALSSRVDFTHADVSPLCIRREGMLKIRDVDQRDKDVVVTYAVLTKDRLSYFVNVKDESSIQGSIELAHIKESLKLINGFPTCFTIKTIDGVSDCSVCAESDDSAREWINAVTQNAVNCNTISVLNNMKKRGLLSQ